VYENHYFELETFVDPPIGLSILVVECLQNDKVAIPSFLKVEANITNATEFDTRNIARICASKSQPPNWKEELVSRSERPAE